MAVTKPDWELVQRYNSIPRFTATAYDMFFRTWKSCDDEIHVILVRDINDVELLNEWFNREGVEEYSYKLTSDDIGKRIVLTYPIAEDEGKAYWSVSEIHVADFDKEVSYAVELFENIKTGQLFV